MRCRVISLTSCTPRTHAESSKAPFLVHFYSGISVVSNCRPSLIPPLLSTLVVSLFSALLITGHILRAHKQATNCASPLRSSMDDYWHVTNCASPLRSSMDDYWQDINMCIEFALTLEWWTLFLIGLPDATIRWPESSRILEVFRPALCIVRWRVFI
jgi:hypothetical protein